MTHEVGIKTAGLMSDRSSLRLLLSHTALSRHSYKRLSSSWPSFSRVIILLRYEKKMIRGDVRTLVL